LSAPSAGSPRAGDQAGWGPEAFEYTFPAIRGVQAGREFYVTMVPLRLLERLFPPGEAEPDPGRRSQRQLGKARFPKIARYITSNPDSYVLPALTASVDADFRFARVGEEGNGRRLGVLAIPLTARFTLNDGQHRAAAVMQALKESPGLDMETIPIVLFADIGLARSQQVFADLNRNAVHPAASITVLYDHRDDAAIITRHVIKRVPLLGTLTDTERSALPRRSTALFTLSALNTANRGAIARAGRPAPGTANGTGRHLLGYRRRPVPRLGASTAR
jgi:DNA sulfur modification protein DndB